MANQQTVESFLRLVSKTAAESGAGDPGSIGGASTHPSAKAPDDLSKATTGAQAASTEKLLHENVPESLDTKPEASGTGIGQSAAAGTHSSMNPTVSGAGKGDSGISETFKDPGSMGGATSSPAKTAADRDLLDKAMKAVDPKVPFQAKYAALSNLGRSLMDDLLEEKRASDMHAVHAPAAPKKPVPAAPYDKKAQLLAREFGVDAAALIHLDQATPATRHKLASAGFARLLDPVIAMADGVADIIKRANAPTQTKKANPSPEELASAGVPGAGPEVLGQMAGGDAGGGLPGGAGGMGGDPAGAPPMDGGMGGPGGQQQIDPEMLMHILQQLGVLGGQGQGGPAAGGPSDAGAGGPPLAMAGGGQADGGGASGGGDGDEAAESSTPDKPEPKPKAKDEGDDGKEAAQKTAALTPILQQKKSQEIFAELAARMNRKK